MKKQEKIVQFVKDTLEMYSLNYNEIFADFEENSEDTEATVLNPSWIKKACVALGLTEDEVINMDEKASGKWYRKYPYFFHLTGLNFAYKETYYDDAYLEERMLARLFDVEPDEHRHLRYDYKDITQRMVESLKEYDRSIPGTFHRDAKITKLSIGTENFCHFPEIADMINSFADMVEHAKELFFKAIDENLTVDEINEYNFLATTIGIRDKIVPTLGILTYEILCRYKEIYRKENLKDFYAYVNLWYIRMFNPWRCAEFVQDRCLVKKYLDIYPFAKKQMREFAMEAMKFKCIFVWSDAEPIKDPEEFADDLADSDDIFGTDLHDIPKEETIVFVDKTEEELNGTEKIAEQLMALCRPAKLGGIDILYREPEDLAVTASRITSRLGGGKHE